MGSESTAITCSTGEKFDDTEKAVQCQRHAPLGIFWLTKMPSNFFPTAPQQGGGEFGSMLYHSLHHLVVFMVSLVIGRPARRPLPF